MKKTAIFACVILGAGMATSASAQNLEFDPDNFYAGGGIGINSVSGLDDAIGPNLFAGYNMGEIFGVEKLDLMIEAGYMDTGDFGDQCVARDFTGNCISRRSFSASGVWTTGVVRYNLNEQWSFFGRLGLDLGDDDGVMIGGGAEFHLSEPFAIRGELVERDNISSIQANFVWDF